MREGPRSGERADGDRPDGEQPDGDQADGDQHWDVVATSRLDRDLARLPPRVAAAIAEFVTAVLPRSPTWMSEPLTGDLEGHRSARRGDYRVILRLDLTARTVVPHRVAHRARAYRPGRGE